MTEHRVCTLAATNVGTVIDYCCPAHPRAVPSREEVTLRAEVAFVRQGTIVRHDRDGRQLGDTARILCFNPDSPYTIDHPAGAGDRCTVLQFSSDAVRSVLAASGAPAGELDRPFAHTIERDGTSLQALHRRIRTEGREDPRRLDELMLELLGRVLTRGVAPLPGARATRAGKELARAVEVYLADAFAEDVTLDALAFRFGVSPFHLLRVFRTEVGRSIRQHVISLRLNAALEDLVATDRPITEIALRFGFSDHAHFTTSFLRTFGSPPSAWRRRYRHT